VSLHGSFGEDGTMQGLLKLMNLPFVGCSVLGSAASAHPGFDMLAVGLVALGTQRRSVDCSCTGIRLVMPSGGGKPNAGL